MALRATVFSFLVVATSASAMRVPTMMGSFVPVKSSEIPPSTSSLPSVDPVFAMRQEARKRFDERNRKIMADKNSMPQRLMKPLEAAPTSSTPVPATTVSSLPRRRLASPTASPAAQATGWARPVKPFPTLGWSTPAPATPTSWPTPPLTTPWSAYASTSSSLPQLAYPASTARTNMLRHQETMMTHKLRNGIRGSSGNNDQHMSHAVSRPALAASTPYSLVGHNDENAADYESEVMMLTHAMHEMGPPPGSIQDIIGEQRPRKRRQKKKKAKKTVIKKVARKKPIEFEPIKEEVKEDSVLDDLANRQVYRFQIDSEGQEKVTSVNSSQNQLLSGLLPSDLGPGLHTIEVESDLPHLEMEYIVELIREGFFNEEDPSPKLPSSSSFA